MEELTETRRGRPPGTPKTGGRKKGTPNRITAETRNWLQKFLKGKRADIVEAWDKLKPVEKIEAYQKLLSYIVPKQQAATAELETRIELNQIAKTLDELPDEAITQLATKMLEIKEPHE